METLNLHPFSNFPSNPQIRNFRLKFTPTIPHYAKPKFLIPLRPTPHFQLTRCRADASHHGHTHHHHHHTRVHDHHHHCHNHGGDGSPLTKPQETFLNFADSVKWTDLANFLREHLGLCCMATALFLAAGVSPHLFADPAIAKSLQHALTVVAFPIVGVPASFDAALDIVGGKVNIHVLMALAAFASVFMGNTLEGGLLLAMFNLAHIAEDYFTSKSKVDVKELKENHPEFALVLDLKDGTAPSFDSVYHRVPVNDLDVGSYILVKAGESVPVDCQVFQGRSTITIEHLTGEVKPLEKKVGDTLPGGARNLDGMMIVKVKKPWKDSMLSQIMQLTEEAQLSKPKLQRWLDKFGEQYSKVVIVLSAVVALVGPLLFKWPVFSTAVCRGSVYRALGLI